jgi:hypothetical protein
VCMCVCVCVPHLTKFGIFSRLEESDSCKCVHKVDMKFDTNTHKCTTNAHTHILIMQVRYKRLEKGTFVEFQPLSRGFHEAVGEDIKQVNVVAKPGETCVL